MASERKEIKAENLSLVRNISNSRMARVDLCRWKRSGEQILVAKKSLLTGNTLQFRKQLESETEILFDIQHENIVETIGFIHSSSEFGLVMKYYKYGSYHKAFIETNCGSMRTDEHAAQLFPLKLRILKELASAMNYLHSKRPKFYLHLDIKADNVLITDDLHAILTDFGLSEAKTISRLSRQSSCCATGGAMKGTLFYISPERLADIRCKPTFKTDVYAFGILAWQILADLNPYDDICENPNVSLVLHHIQTNDCRPDLESIPPCVPQSLAKNVVELAWAKNPQDRPMFHDICELLDKELQELKNFSADLQDAIVFALTFIKASSEDGLPVTEPEQPAAATQPQDRPISWEIVSQAIQRRGGVSRLNYGDHPIVATTEINFRGFKVVWDCKCMDVKTGHFTEVKHHSSPGGVCEVAASRLIRQMIDRGIYPKPIDEHKLRA